MFCAVGVHAGSPGVIASSIAFRFVSAFAACSMAMSIRVAEKLPTLCMYAVISVICLLLFLYCVVFCVRQQYSLFATVLNFFKPCA